MKEKLVHIGSYVLVAILATMLTLTMVHLQVGLKPTKLDQLEALIREKSIENNVDFAKLEDAAAEAMVNATDRWSYYIPASEYASYLETSENAYVGVGMTIQATEDGSGFLIVDLIPDAPAAEAGIQIKDLLTRVGDTDIREMTAEQLYLKCM